MENNNYLIPANSKRGNLIFSMFRPFDLILVGSGIGVTVLSLMIFSSSGEAALILALVPAVVTSILVMPVPNQHNILVLLGAIFKFLTTQQKYKWKGWSMYESFKQKGEK